MKFYYKHRKAFNILIKVAILVLLLAGLYWQVFVIKDFKASKEQYLEAIKQVDLFLVAIVFMLMLINWGLEAIKWKWIINRIEDVSLWHSFKAVFGGVTFSIFTPNRIGEFAGRVFFLKRANKITAVIMTLVGSYSQLIVNILIGLIALNYFLIKYKNFERTAEIFYVILSALLILGLLILYFNIKSIPGWIKRIKLAKRFEKHSESLSNFNNNELLSYLILSLLRYIVYSVQYLLLLQIFGIHIDILLGLIVISMIFISQTAVPVPTILELGVRGNFAIVYLGMVSIVAVNELSVLSASFGLWAVNIIFPALIGALFILRINFIKK